MFGPGKTFLELGAGCGLPSSVAMSYLSNLSQVVFSDLKEMEQECYANMEHNCALSVEKSKKIRKMALKKNKPLPASPEASCMSIDWTDPESWPKTKMSVIVGSDLVYSKELVPALVNLVDHVLEEGGVFLYASASTNRQGMGEFRALLEDKLTLVQHVKKIPETFKQSPLVEADERFKDHFADLQNQHDLYLFRKEKV